MCDPLSIAIIGAGVGGGLANIFSTVDLVSRYDQQNEMNEAIEDAYNQELELARSQAIIDQQNLNIETQSEQLANRQEQLQDSRESMADAAAAEAAASSLNIAGNTAQRREAVADVNTLNRQGAFEARGEAIQSQHLMNALGIKQTYDNNVRSARYNAEAAWRPLTGNFFEEAFKFNANMISGAASGASLGMMAEGLFGGAGKASYSVTDSPDMLSADSPRWNASSGRKVPHKLGSWFGR